MTGQASNRDTETVKGFGEEWQRFDQSELPAEELDRLFGLYFAQFPWERLPPGARGFDLGCGSGRWAKRVAARAGELHCVDASGEALDVARRNLADLPQCRFHQASVEAIPLEDSSMDFGYSLGVLHHIPDTAAGIQACVSKLKPGAPFLVYLYYAFDQRGPLFKTLWRASDLGSRAISRLPSPLRARVCEGIAAAVYWPAARASRWLEYAGMDVASVPLSFYRDKSFYTMRTDALDRFGTRLEQRFTAPEIRRMMEAAGLENIVFNEHSPFWCALGYRR